MAQIRLTINFAKDLKMDLSKSPEIREHPLDDWIGDVFRINRKKIALLTHVQTMISFLYPYSEVGGAKNVLDFLPIDIERYLRIQGFENWIDSMTEIFNQIHVFTKTENRKVTGHMNDFKQAVFYSRNYSDEHASWQKISADLKDIPLNLKGFFKTPNQLLKALYES